METGGFKAHEYAQSIDSSLSNKSRSQWRTTVFRCKEFMTQEQHGIAEDFQSAIEAEYVLCVREIGRINQAIANNGSPESNGWNGIDCANLEVYSIQKYWHNRLDCLINFIAEKDPEVNNSLAIKYLNGVKTWTK